MSFQNDWMIESMVQFMQCPEWVTPVQQFIDTHCILFDTEEESRLEFTTIHNSFKSMCESLLEGFLNEIGIPLETFVSVAADASRNPTNPYGHAATQVLEYLLSIDKFITFKNMMEKRNIMLELEVMEELQSQANAAAGAGTSATEGELDEEEELRLAIEASLREYENIKNKSKELDDLELQEALKLSEEINNVAPPPENVPPPPVKVVREMEKIRQIENKIPEVVVSSTPTETKTSESSKIPPKTPPNTPINQDESSNESAAPVASSTPAPVEGKHRALAALSSHRGGAFGQHSVLPGIPHSHQQNMLSGMGAPKAQLPSIPSKEIREPVNQKISAEEAEKRAEYMKAQKERIINKKNEQRQKELTNYMEEQGKKIEINHATKVEEKMSPEEVEAMQKRLALASRFREDLMQVTRQAALE